MIGFVRLVLAVLFAAAWLGFGYFGSSGRVLLAALLAVVGTGSAIAQTELEQ